ADEVAESVEEIDYSGYSKGDFANLLKELSQESDIRRADQVSRQARTHIDELREQERTVALQRFLAEGGKEEEFSLRGDDNDLVIDGAYKLIREKKNRYNREQDEQRNQNLHKKEALLARIREVVEREDAISGFQEFKKLQDEWRAIGPVPAAQIKPMWASYHALVDRFYDHRKIHFELIELDRRKNLDAKIELCVRAEKAAALDSLNTALREVNELHNEWRHIGPVPRDEKEPVWARFKAASDKVYDRRDAHVKERSVKHKENLALKLQVIEKIEPFAAFQSQSMKEWNARTQQLTALKAEWEGIGPVDRKQTKEVNKKFWAAFKTFFQHKGQFFKKLDAEREGNLAQKRALVDQAVALKDNEDWTGTADKIKELQRQWKEIGPVPEKMRNKIFDEFRAACDHFFNRLRDSSQQAERELDEHLKQKEAVLAEMAGLAGADAMEAFRGCSEKFNAIGHVPRKSVGSIREQYDKAIARFTATLPEEGGLRDKFALELSLSGMKGDPDAGRGLQQQEQQIRRRLQQAENDLAVLKNNLEFFARSKNATQVRADFQVKIDAATAEVASLKAKLKLVRAAF
ncbi:MAG: DUF349 domain-containing protein, partial [Bacteroidota bacterium]